MATDFKDRLRTWHHTARSNPVMRYPYKILVLLTGTVVFLAGILMLVLPGPGILGMGIGLMILSTEFPWAERALKACTRKLKQWWHALCSRWKRRSHKESHLARNTNSSTM